MEVNVKYQWPAPVKHYFSLSKKKEREGVRERNKVCERERERKRERGTEKIVQRRSVEVFTRIKQDK